MKKRLILTSIISIVLIVILMIGSTYSLFVTTNVDDNLNVYKTGNLDVEYTVSNNNSVYSSKKPVSGADVIRVKPYRITVENKGNVPYMFNVILNRETTGATESVDPKYIVTKVGKLEPKSLVECTDGIIKEDIIVPAGESAIIDVRVYLSDDVKNTEIGNSFYANLSIDGLAIYNENDDIDNSILMLPKNTLVTFDANGGVLNDFTSKELESGSLYGEMPNDIVRHGYTFDGWYTEKTGGVEVTENDNLILEDDHTLYARWIANTYTVTFDANGGTIPSIASKNVAYENEYGELATTTREDYVFVGWFTERDGGQLVTSTSKVLMTENHTLYAKWSDNSLPIATISTTSTLKSTTQTATLICSSNNEIVSYYWGTNFNPLDSDYISGNPTSKEISNVGTYYLFCKDTNGNVNTIGTSLATGKAVYYKYTINNMLDKVDGTQGTYTTGNYEQNSTNTYLAPSGTSLTLESIYTEPGTVGTQVTFIGGSTGAASTTASTVSTTVPTLNDNTTYSMWFNRKSYTLTLNKGTGISSVSGAGSKKWGASVTIDATASTGYTWVNWTGYSTITTKNYTFTMPAQAVTYTANATDQTAPSTPTITRSDYNTFTYSATDSVGVTGYYVSKSSTEPTPSPAQSTFALDTWTTATSTGNLTLSAGTYYVWARDAAGNVSSYASIGAYTVTRSVGTGSSLITRYDSTSSTTGTSFTPTTFVVLSGTNIWSKATENTGYNTPILERGGSTVTNPSYASVTGDVRIVSSATANTYTVKFYDNRYYLKGGSRVVVALLDGRLFYKPYTDASLVGLYYDGTYTGPLLVGTTANSVKYSESYSGSEHASTSTFTYNGTTYYYSAWSNVMAGNLSDSSGLSTGIKYSVSDSATREAAAIALISDSYSTNTSKGQLFIYGESKNLNSNTFTKTGYTFKGWATSPTGSVVYIDAQSVSNLTTTNFGTVNLYAVWEAKSNTVTFNANGGTVSTPNNTVTYNSTYGNLPAPTKSGYTFIGWYTSASGGTKVESDTIVKTASNHVLYARWIKLTLNYQDNVLENISKWIPDNSSTYLNRLEGDNGQPAMRFSTTSVLNEGFRIKVDSDKLASTSNRKMELNYAVLHKGMQAQSEFVVERETSPGVEPVGGGIIRDTYAALLDKGKSVREEYYDINMNNISYFHFYLTSLNDGPMWVSDVQLNSWEISDDLSLPTPTRTGYTFEGWYDVKDTPTIVTNEVDFNENVQADLLTNNQNRRTMMTNLEYNTTYVVSMDSASLIDGTATQFEFRIENAWASGTYYSSVTKSFGDNISFEITTPTASTASNSRLSLVFYTGVRGNAANNVIKFTNIWVREKYVRDANGNPTNVLTTRTRYTDTNNLHTTPNFTNDTTLYAHWKPKTFTVKFNANGGSVSTSTKTVTYDSLYGPLPTPTKSNSTFKGWYTSASGGTKIERSTLVTRTADTQQTLYARWSN